MIEVRSHYQSCKREMLYTTIVTEEEQKELSPTGDLSHGPINFKMNMETFAGIADNCTKQYELNLSFNSNTMKIMTT